MAGAPGVLLAASPSAAPVGADCELLTSENWLPELSSENCVVLVVSASFGN